MHMVAHQHVTVNGARMLFSSFNHVIKIPQAIIIAAKNNLPIIPPLHHMLRKPRNKEAPTPSHAIRVDDGVRAIN